MSGIYFSCKCGRKAYREIRCDCGRKSYYCSCNTFPNHYIVCTCDMKYKIDSDYNAVKIEFSNDLPYVAQRCGLLKHHEKYGKMLMVFGNGNTPLISARLLNMIMRPEDINAFLRCVRFMSYEYENSIDFSNIVVLCANLGDGTRARAKDDKILLDYDILNERYMSKTYIHEVVHHFQYQRKILTKDREGYLEWYGKSEPYKGLNWSERPWEKHAVNMTNIHWDKYNSYV